MNEMASQVVIGGAVIQLQVVEIHSFLRGTMLTWKSGLLSGRIAGLWSGSPISLIPRPSYRGIPIKLHWC